MGDIEELKRLLGEVKDILTLYNERFEDNRIEASIQKTTDALSLLEGDMVMMTTDELTELLRLSVKLGTSEAFASIGLKLKPPAEHVCSPSCAHDEEPDHLSTSEVVAILKPPTEEPERVGKGTSWDTGDARVNELLDQGCELGEALEQTAKDRKKEEE